MIQIEIIQNEQDKIYKLLLGLYNILDGKVQ
jgi:hypothetical protein